MTRHLLMITAVVLSSFVATPSFAQEGPAAIAVKDEFKAKLSEMSDENRAVVQDKLQQLLDEAEQANMIHKMSTNDVDDKIRGMVCVQAQGGILLIAGQGLECVNTDGDTITLESFGAFELTVAVSGGVALGYHYGPARNGSHSVKVGAGLHILIGGSVLITGPYRLLNVGLGVGGTLKYEVPRDSMFGGQIRASVSK